MLVDQVVYRGYLIHLIAEADLWNTPGAEAGWSFHRLRRAQIFPSFRKLFFAVSTPETRLWPEQRRRSIACYRTDENIARTLEFSAPARPCKQEKPWRKQAARFRLLL
jgi:hypothetical protein